jgi:hypothetical protein
MLIEKLDPAQGDPKGAVGNMPGVFQVEKVLPQFLFTDLLWRTVIVFGELPNSLHIRFLRSQGKSAQLHIGLHFVA